MAYQDIILDNPTNPRAWLNAIRQEVAQRYPTYNAAQKRQKVAEALQAYLEEASPKTVHELLTMVKDRPAEAQVWISILPASRKAQLVSDIEAAIRTIDPNPTPAEPDLRRAVTNLLNVMQRAIPTNTNGNKTTFKTFLDKYKTHSKLNTKPRGGPDTYLEMIMNVLETNKSKFKGGDYNYLMGELGRLQGGFLESVYPVGQDILNGLKLK